MWSVFNKHGFFKAFSIPILEFCNFIETLRFYYNRRSNNFHNWNHAINVFYGSYRLSQGTRAKNYIGDLETFSLIFSGLCHDVDHTGRTNVFECNSLSPLAIRYHD